MMLKPDEIAFLTVYVIFMVIITAGNIMVIVIVCLKSDLKNSKNLQLLSLSCSDLLVGTLLIPNVITMRYSKMDWSKSWCLVCLYMEHVAAAACMLTITAMAIDRFLSLAYPMKTRVNKREIAFGTIAVVWIISFLYAIRVPLIYDINTRISKSGNKTTTKFSCTVTDSSDLNHQIVSVVDFMLLFFVPAVVLTVTNGIITFKLTQNNGMATSKTSKDKKIKAMRLLLVMVVIFLVCHVPSSAARLHKTVVDKKMKNYKYIGMSFQVLSWSSSFINVLFYGSLNDEVKNMRNKIKNVICKLCSCCCKWKGTRVNPAPASQISSIERNLIEAKTVTTAVTSKATMPVSKPSMTSKDLQQSEV